MACLSGGRLAIKRGRGAAQLSSSTSRSLSIIWEQPLQDGGAPITAYNVSWRATGSPHSTTVNASVAVRYVVARELAEFTGYVVSVAASNVGAQSAWAQSPPLMTLPPVKGVVQFVMPESTLTKGNASTFVLQLVRVAGSDETVNATVQALLSTDVHSCVRVVLNHSNTISCGSGRRSGSAHGLINAVSHPNDGACAPGPCTSGATALQGVLSACLGKELCTFSTTPAFVGAYACPDGVMSFNVTCRYDARDVSTALPGRDFVGSSPIVVRFGQDVFLDSSVSVALLHDHHYVVPLFITFVVVSGGHQETAVLYLLDDGAAGNVSLDNVAIGVLESAGSVSLRLVRAAVYNDIPLHVTWSTFSGSAAAPLHYVQSLTTTTIAAGAWSSSISVCAHPGSACVCGGYSLTLYCGCAGGCSARSYLRPRGPQFSYSHSECHRRRRCWSNR